MCIRDRAYTGHGFTFEHPAGMVIREGGPLWETATEKEGMVQFAAYPGPSHVINVTWESAAAPRRLDRALEDVIGRLEEWARRADYRMAFTAEGEPMHTTLNGHEVFIRRYVIEEEGQQWANVMGIWHCDESNRLFIFSHGVRAGSSAEADLMGEVQQHQDGFSCH